MEGSKNQKDKKPPIPLENQRIRQIREELGLDQVSFAESINMKQGSISDVERGKAHVSDKLLKSLENVHGVNPNFIRNGNDPKFINVTPAHINAKSAIIPDNNQNNLFVIPIKAYGGFLAGYSNKAYMDSLEKFPFPFVRGKCYAFEIEGFSMVSDDVTQDSYPPGSWVITTEVEHYSWCQKGKVYVFATIDGICIKEFVKVDDEFYYLKSINTSKEYKVPPIPLKAVKKIFHVELKMAKPFY